MNTRAAATRASFFVLPEPQLERLAWAVTTPDTGGGFGQKAHLYCEELVMPLVAREVGVPVKWVEDRRENLMAGTHAHEQYATIAYALDSDAKITGCAPTRSATVVPITRCGGRWRWSRGAPQPSPRPACTTCPARSPTRQWRRTSRRWVAISSHRSSRRHPVA